MVAPALAQRGGGHGSFGGHGGGFAAHGSFGSHFSGHAFGGMHSGRGMAGHGFNRGPAFSRRAFSSRNSQRNFRRFRGPFLRNASRFRRRGWGWPWWGGYYDPWWWDSDSYSSYDPDYERQLEIAQEMNEQSLEEQQMRSQQNRDLYAHSTPPQARQETHAESPVPPTVLVFRDQHQQEVQNYAIVGQTLWNFAPQRTQKIPLSDLDVPTTTKVNDDRGVDFRVPGSGEGQ